MTAKSIEAEADPLVLLRGAPQLVVTSMSGRAASIDHVRDALLLLERHAAAAQA